MTPLVMSKSWGREDPDLEYKMGQQITLRCGIDACGETWTGELGTILPKRDGHRAEAHPKFVPPKRKQPRGFTKRTRVDAVE